MSGGEWAILATLMALCLGLSFFLSGMETGLVELSRLRLRRMAREGNERARRLQGYIDQPEDTLWTILVGNTVANLFAVLIWLYSLQHLLSINAAEPSALFKSNSSTMLYWVLFIIGTFFFYTLCELLPKMLFRTYATRLTIFLVGLFGVVDLLFNPLVKIMRALSQMLLFTTGAGGLAGHLFGSREELRQMMAESGQVLTRDERVMIDRVLDLQKIPVRDLAVPFENLPHIDEETPVIDLIRNHAVKAYTRIPVWQEGESSRRVVGVINLRQLVFMAESEWHRPAKHFVESALYQDEDIRLQKLLTLMQRSGQRVVIILDKRKRELGIVSLPDILKSVFGEVKV